MDQNQETNQTPVGVGNKAAESAPVTPVAVGSKIPTLRTYKIDAEDYIKDRNLSRVDIAAEQMRAARTGLGEETAGMLMSTKILLGVVVLLLFGIGGGVWYFLRPNEPQVSQPVTAAQKSIIAAESVKKILASNQSTLTENIQQAMNSRTPLNQLLNIQVYDSKAGIERIVGTAEFLRLAGISLPQKLADALNEKFMLAKFYFSRDWPILIFKLDSYDNAFVGAVKWEPTMFDDLNDIFSLNKVDKKTLASGFIDKEVEGRDTRVLNDKTGKTVLVYSFINRKYMVITTDLEPLKEMFKRFSSSQYLNE